MKFNQLKSGITACAVLVLASSPLFFPNMSYAIPVFARQYQTSCATCHVDFPKLNDFGKAFKDAGFKFPEDDETNLKSPPVLLGADAQKLAFPNAIWPGQIPGLPPIGLRMNNFLQFTSNKRNRFNSLAEPGTTPQVIPGSDFETGLFSLFTAGNFGDGIAFWVDDDISVAGDNAAGGLGDAYLKFVDVSRLMKLPKDSLSFRVGQFELDLPVTQARSMNLSPYDIYEQANIGVMNPLGPQQNVLNQFTFGGAALGAEVSGGHQYGGYHYSFAVFDQNTSGIAQSENASAFVPSATGSANGGVGFGSDTGIKNIYGRFSYRFNLERDRESRRAVQAASATGPREHTYLSLGTFYMRGKPQLAVVGEDADGSSKLLYANAPFYRVGGDFSFNYRKLNVYGLYMYAHDDNLLPVDAFGVPIPLPFASEGPVPAGFVTRAPARFNGGFVQADYLALPWIMLIGRWDQVNSSADRINALADSTSFFAPYSSSRNRFTPGVQFLIRANLKAAMEYQIRPQQSVTSVTDPVTGLQRATDPFRVNTVLFSTDFVF
jgi:hypothetical protein